MRSLRSYFYSAIEQAAPGRFDKNEYVEKMAEGGHMGAVKALLEIGAEINVIERVGKSFMREGQRQIDEGRGFLWSSDNHRQCARRARAGEDPQIVRDVQEYLGGAIRKKGEQALALGRRHRWLGSGLLKAAGWTEEQTSKLQAETGTALAYKPRGLANGV